MIMTLSTPPVETLQQIDTSYTYSYYDGDYIARYMTHFNIPSKFLEMQASPTLIQYHFDLLDHSKNHLIKRAIASLSKHLKTGVYEVPSKIGFYSLVIELKERATVHFIDLICNEKYHAVKKHSAVIGTTSENEPAILDFEKSPHVLIAGSSGSGKSVLLNTLICSILYGSLPFHMGLVLIDPKQVEFTKYEGIPHLMDPVCTSTDGALSLLRRLNAFMDDRYTEMAQKGLTDISQLDEPRVIIIIDELSDLMYSSQKEAEDYIVRIAQKGRAAGLHLVLATQRPVVQVITGLIKANMTTRIALTTTSIKDSINILDHAGAEKLRGKGDAIIKFPHTVEEFRTQIGYISDRDIQATIQWWRARYKRALEEIAT